MTRLVTTLCFRVVCALGPIALVACESDTGDEHGNLDPAETGEHAAGEHGEHSMQPVGPPSGAICPTGSTLTYANFGKAFFSSYCLRCHSQAVVGAARMMAPADHNFDTIAEIELLMDHIDQKAAAGATVVNQTMPPTDPKPTLDDRKKLGEWLACGLKE